MARVTNKTQCSRYPREELPLSEEQGTRALYEGGGFFMRADGEGLAVITASTWGGGGDVNWSACLQVSEVMLMFGARPILTSIDARICERGMGT